MTNYIQTNDNYLMTMPMIVQINIVRQIVEIAVLFRCRFFERENGESLWMTSISTAEQNILLILISSAQTKYTAGGNNTTVCCKSWDESFDDLQNKKLSVRKIGGFL